MSDGERKPILTVARGLSVQQSRSWWHFVYGKYLPATLLEKFDTDEPYEPTASNKRVPAAVCFVDISGFTKLSEKLILIHGDSASEKLTKYISDYFEKLVSVVYAHGGDIIKFAGDAMLVMWRSPRKKTKGITEKNIKLLGTTSVPVHTLVLRAASCALAIMKSLNNFSPAKGYTLNLHIGIGAGEISELIVGGIDNAWEFFIAGTPIQEMGDALEGAQTGEIALSETAYSLIKNWAVLKSDNSSLLLASGLLHKADINEQSRILENLTEEVPMNRTQICNVPAASEPFLELFIPRIVRARIEHNEQTGIRVAEYRRAYVMFAKILGVDYDKPDVLDTLNESVRVVQGVIKNFEGTVLRLLADDKGTRFKIVFGMPGLMHEDDASRCILAGLEIIRLLPARCNTQAVIGLSVGTVFCGEAGSSARCEYTAVGFHVNLAARLMQQASQLEKGILCSAELFTVAKRQAVVFENCGDVTVKGLSHPITVYRPLGLSSDPNIAIYIKRFGVNVCDSGEGAHGSRATMSEGSIVNRLPERSKITAAIQAVVNDDETQTRILVFEGEKGSGKTTLVRFATTLAATKGVNVHYCTGSISSASTPWSPWTTMLFQALMFDEVRRTEERLSLIVSMLPADLKEMAFVVAELFGLKFTEAGGIPSVVSGEERRSITHRCVLAMATAVLTRSKCLFVLEDLHCFDGPSFEVVLGILKPMQQCCCIVTYRPFSSESKAHFVSQLTQIGIRPTPLLPFAAADIVTLACMKLGVKSLPRPVEVLFEKHTQCNPLFAIDLAQTLLQTNAITIENGVCVGAMDNIDASAISQNVRAIIASRIDRLSANLQLTMQVMSVLGKEFNLSLLSAVHPRVNYLQAIQQHLRDLVKEGYISIVSRSSAAASMSDDSEPQSSAPDIPLDAVISFTSELFRDVAYGTLLQEQQIEIHAAAFKYMLKDRETNKHSQYQPASLAYHAFCASMWQNALEFLEATIEECLERHAWAEALTHLGARMIILEKRLNEPRPKDALDTRFKIYQLNATIGEFDVALKSAIRCLELLKVRLPRMHRTLEFADPGIPTKIVESFNSLGVGSHKPIPKLAAKLVTVEQSGQEPTRRAVEILLDMQRSAMMAEHVDLNNLCVTSAANLCKTRLDDRTLLAYCYASCAYASRYVFESGDLGEAFRAKAEELLRPSRTEPSAYQLGALTMLAMFEASQGQWLHAIEMFSQTVDMYRTLDGGARTRDSKFSIAVIHHLRGRFETCLEELALLEDSMPAADDHFSILELLDSAIGMNVGKMGHSNDLSVVVFREYVAFLLGDSAPASIVTFLNTFTEVQQKRRPIIWYDWPSRWYFGMLALSAAESVAVDGNSETFGHLVAHASYGVQLMAAFAACFPYALPLMLILKARLLFLQGNASEATAAALQASNTCSVTQLKFFGALSLIQLAKHAGCDEDKKGIVHQARLDAGRHDRRGSRPSAAPRQEHLHEGKH